MEYNYDGGYDYILVTQEELDERQRLEEERIRLAAEAILAAEVAAAKAISDRWITRC
tara:strand:+ start:345 stop:515 length:171 start_codon:yes stop_codon:yes gene_type:complete